MNLLARLFRRRPTRAAEYEAAMRRHPANACAICERPAGMGHNNRAHDAHISAWTGTAVPVDGKPAPTRAEILAKERARYDRELNAYLAATEGKTA